MNKVRRELPAFAKCLRQRSFSKLMKAGDMATLTVYQGKPKKNVCVLSFLHMSVELGESEEKTPETVEFYNKTKGGVDVADQMVRQYSFKAGTRRCPVAVFYNILDLAGINAFVLYKKRIVDKVSRRDFLFKLATELCEDYIVERSSRKVLLLDLTHYRQLLKNQSRESKQCQIAANCTRNKTSKLCFKFNKTVCGECTATELPNELHLRQCKYESFSNFVSSFCPFLPMKLFFVDRLIELRDLSNCSTLKLYPHHAYTSKNAFS